MYELIGRAPESKAQNYSLAEMAGKLDLERQLQAREKRPPEDLTAALATRAAAHGK